MYNFVVENFRSNLSAAEISRVSTRSVLVEKRPKIEDFFGSQIPSRYFSNLSAKVSRSRSQYWSMAGKSMLVIKGETFDQDE